jgi:hypothetical protein
MNKVKPFLGFGPGTYSFQYGVYQEPEFETPITTYFGDNGTCHSEYLGPLAESGWLGLLTGQGKLKGSDVTEYSIGDERGDFPTVVPTLDEYERISVAKGIITPSIAKKAAAYRDLMQSQGQSPFYNASGMK